MKYALSPPLYKQYQFIIVIEARPDMHDIQDKPMRKSYTDERMIIFAKFYVDVGQNRVDHTNI